MRNFYRVISWSALLIMLPGYLLAQAQRITGRVTSAQDGQTLPGVNVVVKGTTIGATTDANGNYSIVVPGPGAVLVLTSIGLNSQEVPVNNRTVVNIVMQEAINELTQVVVTGYNTTQRKDITGSIASVSPDRFKNIPVTGVDQALQGQAAGVLVQQSSGTPGGGLMVRIRGNTSISAGNRPLYIVDGIQVQNSALTSGYGGQNDNALALLNPGDIESIQVLKDASAKAIYGSRAANGVVLITTKRGKANQKTNITADVQRGMTDLVKRPNLLNASQLLDLQREAVINAGQDPDKLGLIKGVTDGINTNWLDMVLRKGVYQQYQVSAQGGNERTRFYISGNYRDEQGVLINNGFQRMSGTMTIDHNATSKLSFGTNMTVTRSLNSRVLGDNALNGVYSGAVASLPYYSPYNEQGQLYGPSDPNYPGFPNFNPVAEALLPRQQVLTIKMLGGVYAEYEFLQNLRFRSKASVDYNNITENLFYPSTTSTGGAIPSLGQQGYGEYNTNLAATFTSTNTITYNTLINEKHRLSALGGVEIMKQTNRTSFVDGKNFPRDEFTYITSAQVVDAGSSYLVNNGLFSGFGEVKYDYKEKYLVTATGRYDGSSRFGQNRQFGFFPSGSVAWRLSEEEFLSKYSFLSDLKLRASYGFTGNEQIGNFLYLGTWGATSYSGSSGLGPSRLSNPNLQWERTREANVGLDASFFNGRLNATVEVYDNLTDKLLFNQPIPLTSGFGSFQGNVGKMSNRGIELTLSSVNIDQKGLRWSTDLNLSRNENKVVELVSDQPIYAGFQASGTPGTNIVLPGQPLGSYWGLKFLGVDPGTGNAIYDDKNGDGRITPDDAQLIGNAQPKLYGGLTNRFTYKGFELSVFFQFSYGNRVVNLTKQGLVNSGSSILTNQSTDALKRWQKEGDITSVPRYIYQNTYNDYFSSRFVEDGSYLRLKNVSLGYNLPKIWVNKVKLANVRIYTSATNLWTYTKYSGSDPEVSAIDGSTAGQGIDLNTLPQVKNMMAGLTVTF
ncbi:SusC/RagA family TonB-linked outer membrane protein [Spirosoma panaciterrae]|uniref:SusC/RagA family TonB-linked outer membrane protein n=1 Tax=Spirosoma panaciterrae TaxID=496058 RepID=UPI00037D4902|nr:TonB-dependent receptor [Spirosoma panaciterrae]